MHIRGYTRFSFASVNRERGYLLVKLSVTAGSWINCLALFSIRTEMRIPTLIDCNLFLLLVSVKVERTRKDENAKQTVVAGCWIFPVVSLKWNLIFYTNKMVKCKGFLYFHASWNEIEVCITVKKVEIFIHQDRPAEFNLFFKMLGLEDKWRCIELSFLSINWASTTWTTIAASGRSRLSASTVPRSTWRLGASTITPWSASRLSATTVTSRSTWRLGASVTSWSTAWLSVTAITSLLTSLLAISVSISTTWGTSLSRWRSCNNYSLHYCTISNKSIV